MEHSNIPAMLRRMVKLAKTAGTLEDKVLAPRYAAKIEEVIAEIEGDPGVLAVSFAQGTAAQPQPEGGE
jgi:hypothetical protein